jgi:hypothetical protein
MRFLPSRLLSRWFSMCSLKAGRSAEYLSPAQAAPRCPPTGSGSRRQDHDGIRLANSQRDEAFPSPSFLRTASNPCGDASILEALDSVSPGRSLRPAGADT